MYPRLDPTVSLAEISRLAARVKEAMRRARRRPAADVLADVLGRGEGFGGDVVDYDDPEMSHLNRVLARRRGLPILLSVLWIEVARAAGIQARPLPFPGHFVVLVDDVIVDPYRGGRRLEQAEVLALFEANTGGSSTLERAATPRRVLLRVLANLANAYDRRGDGRRLEAVLSDQLALFPADPMLLARRGVARARFDDRRGALRDLNKALRDLPPGPEFERARTTAAAIVRSHASVN